MPVIEGSFTAIMAGETATIESRLKQLELQNRLLATVLIVSVLFFVLGFVRVPGVVQGSAFQLVDEGGRVRAEIGLVEGAPEIKLMDLDGQERVRLWTDADTTGLFLNDAKGTTRIGVAQFAHGGGGVALHGEDSKGATVLYHKGTGSLRFIDTNGVVTDEFPPRTE
ncbi:MAG: hypothetical protein KF812_00180 [Fimbriimonadaceae bacterium]|nr:hypothetical protein [Fimbriimonadaceae bacterium]